MNIYFVFKGDGYYPIGGWDDNIETHTTLASAEKSAREIGWGQWSHIVEFNPTYFDGELIKRYNTDQGYGEPLIVREVAIDYSKIIKEWEIE